MLINVEGLIGVGKSTLVGELYGTKYFEPVESSTFLEDYYKDPKRWAFAMQINMLCERFQMLQVAQYQSLRGEDVVLDRSIYGDYAFALVQKELGYFTQKEFDTYRKVFNMHLPLLQLPDVVIWLEAPIKTIMNRKNKRSRNCESGIELDYLKKLEEAYHVVLEQLGKYTKVIAVDANKDACNVLGECLDVIHEIKQSYEDNQIKAATPNLRF